MRRYFTRYAMFGLISFAGAMAGCASAGHVYRTGNRGMPPGTGFMPEQLQQRGDARRFSIFVPRDYRADRKWPVIVFLNGAGQNGTGGRACTAVGLGPAVAARAAKFPFIVLFAQTDSSWGAGTRSAADVLHELHFIERRYSVNTNQVFLTGLSGGGYGTWAMGARWRHTFAALAPVAAPGDLKVAARLKHMPIWAFHNGMDPVVWSRNSTNMCNAINKEGGNARLTVYSAIGHDCWKRTYNNDALYAWFLRQKLNAAPTRKPKVADAHIHRPGTVPIEATNLIFAGN